MTIETDGRPLTARRHRRPGGPTASRWSRAMSSRRSPGRRGTLQAFRREPAPRLVAVDDVSLSIGRHETLGLVGESGSGKTTFARCLIRLVEPDAGRSASTASTSGPPTRTTCATIRRRAQMVFQDPYTSLNPSSHGRGGDRASRRASTGSSTSAASTDHVTDAARPRGPASDDPARDGRASSPAASASASRSLARSPPSPRAHPRRRGGQRPRRLDPGARSSTCFEDLVARARASRSSSSPTSSRSSPTSTRRVAIMYLGRDRRGGPDRGGLRAAAPPVHGGAALGASDARAARARDAPALRGELPSPYQMPAGCRFNTRCAFAQERCFVDEPQLEEASPGHRVACHVLPELTVA